MRVCIFQIKGQYAHWRKWFTTTSPLTYSFPPRTAVVGLIGTILGVQRDSVPDVFPIDATQVAVCLTRPIIKDRMPENWRQSPVSIRNGKLDKQSLSKFNEGFQANLEIIRSPCYRIVFLHRDEKLMTNLVSRLKDKRWVFQPYLGIMGFLADVEFEADDEAEEKSAKGVELHSVLPLNEGTEQQIDISDSANYIREERIPLDVLPGRRFKHLILAYEEPNAASLILKAKISSIQYVHLMKTNRNVVFFESCAN